MYETQIFYSSVKESMLDQICKLYIKVYSAPPRNEVIDFKKIKESIRAQIKEGFIYIITQEEELIASFGITKTRLLQDWKELKLNPDQAYLSNIMVSEKFRKKDLGKIMLQELIKIHKDKGEKVYARCRVDAHAIVHLFDQFGFKIINTYESNFNNSLSKRHILEYA